MLLRLRGTQITILSTRPDPQSSLHFHQHIKSHVRMVPQGRVTLLSDEYYQPFVEALTQQLKEIEGGQGGQYEYFCLRKAAHLDWMEWIEQRDLVVLFYNNYTLPQPTPWGPEYLRALRPTFMRHWRKCIRFMDVADQFNAIYSQSPESTSRLCAKLVSIAESSRMMKVSDVRGTYVEIDLSQAKKWHLATGLGSADILPSEVSTRSPEVSGTVHFCGTFLSVAPFARKYGILKEPIQVEIQKARIVHLSGKNRQLIEDLESHFDRSEGNRNLDEIAIGTNLGVPKLFGYNSEFEERHLGLHFGFGGASRGSHHIDFLFSDSQIYFDDRLIFDGSFKFD